MGTLGIEIRLLLLGIGIDLLSAKRLYLRMVQIVMGDIVVTIVMKALLLGRIEKLCHFFRR